MTVHAGRQHHQPDTDWQDQAIARDALTLGSHAVPGRRLYVEIESSLDAEFFEQTVDSVGGKRPADQVTLGVLTLHQAYEFELFDVFDPFGDNRQIHRLTKRHKRLNKRIRGRIETYVPYKRAVDFQDVKRKLPEIAD